MVGAFAGDALNTGSENTAFGYDALGSDTKGNHSTALGRSALATQNFTSAADVYNVAVGYKAGTAVTTGVQNTIVGGLGGDALTTGSNNTVLGAFALSADVAGNWATAIGYNALAALSFQAILSITIQPLAQEQDKQ